MGEKIFFFVFMAAFLGFVFVPDIIKGAKIEKNSQRKATDAKADMEEGVERYIRRYFIPNFDKEEFKQECYKIYLDVQDAWMNFDLDKVKNVLSNELLAQYESQLATLEVKGEQNIMEDFVLVDSILTSAKGENNTLEVTMTLIVRFKDYIINQETKEVLRGSNKTAHTVTYEMTFRKEVSEERTVKCPGCGAEVDIVTSATCPYCHQELVQDSTNWVLTQKRNKYQR